jgi:hypothetical protein
MNVTLEHMTTEDIIDYVRSLDGVLVLTPQEGDGSPEIAWGDAFFYYAPDGVVPRTQPFATVVTKDYPDDTGSRLDRSPGTFRVNIGASSEEFRRWTGRGTREPAPADTDVGVTDTVFAHPVYGRQGWLAVVDPGPRTTTAVRELLASAHARARDRVTRRRPPAAG